MPPSGSVVADVAMVVLVSTEPSVNVATGVISNARPSLISIVSVGFTVSEVPLSPVVVLALTVKSGKSPPALTIFTPASVSVITPVFVSIL